MRKNEVISISEVSIMLSEFEQIDPWISIGDREPIWDGSINYYNGKGMDNNDLIARIPIQVKGQGKGYKEGKGYPVRVDDLRKFRDEGGVLYYVVYGVDSDRGNRQLAYNFLTPSKINNELKNIKSKTKNIQMKKYNGDKDMFLRDIEKFIIDRKLQRGHTDEEWPKIDEIPHKEVNNIVVYNTLKKGEGVEALVDYNDFNVYYEVKGSKILHPVDNGRVERSMVTMKNNVNVEVGGVVYEDTITIMSNNFKKSGYSYNRYDALQVVEGFLVEFNFETGKIQIDLKTPKTVQHCKKWIKIVNDLINTSTIKIGGYEYSLRITGDISKLLEDVTKMYDRYSSILDFSHVSKGISIYSEENIYTLELVDNETKRINEVNVGTDLSLWVIITLEEGVIILPARKEGGVNYIYPIGTANVELYNRLKVETILKCINFNYTHYVDVFKDEGVDIRTANDALLKLIHVADGLQGEEREEVLRYCYTLATEKFSNNNFIHKVNMCQVLYRMGSLTTEQKMELRELSDKSDINCFLVELLTGTPEMAGYHFNRLGDEEKEFLEKLPIYTLYEDSSKV